MLEFLVSNLGPHTDYSQVFIVFLSFSRQMLGQCLKLGHDCFLPHPFNPFFTTTPTFNNTLSEQLKALLNKPRTECMVLNVTQTNEH
jgi:hypothetical protein